MTGQVRLGIKSNFTILEEIFQNFPTVVFLGNFFIFPSLISLELKQRKEEISEEREREGVSRVGGSRRRE